MNFEELDHKMRKYEQSIDQVVLPELFLVARIDGRNFSRLTKETCKFEAPFDIRFRDMMIETVKALMSCGFRVIYGFTESDEISLLFHPNETTFGRKVRKYNSILASQAGATFSLQIGIPCTFDCRIVPLPTVENVIDYFQWRQEDAHRNALNAHCYWMLRKIGYNATEATELLSGKDNAYKNELLFTNGINFNELPSWQKRGIGLYNKVIDKEGYNPVEDRKVFTKRNELYVNFDLQIREKYSEFLKTLIQQNEE